MASVMHNIYNKIQFDVYRISLIFSSYNIFYKVINDILWKKNTHKIINVRGQTYEYVTSKS